MSKGVSVFDKSVVIKGDIVSNGCVDVGCGVIGKIVTDTISVKEYGNIRGDIIANEMILTDKSVVNGNIIAKKIKMLKGCNINGTVIYNILSMEDGSKVFGEVKYCDDKTISDILAQSMNGTNEDINRQNIDDEDNYDNNIG